MKKIFLMLSVLSLTACGGDSGSSSAAKKGIFKATLGDTKYEVAVRCYNFDTDRFDKEFTFVSDNASGKDLDGDGITVRGDRIKLGKDVSPIEVDGMSIDIVDHGISYSANPVVAAMEKREAWTKTSNGITGTDKLYKDEDHLNGEAYLLSYEVICK